MRPRLTELKAGEYVMRIMDNDNIWFEDNIVYHSAEEAKKEFEASVVYHEDENGVRRAVSTTGTFIYGPKFVYVIGKTQQVILCAERWYWDIAKFPSQPNWEHEALTTRGGNLLMALWLAAVLVAIASIVMYLGGWRG